jgi:ribosome-binding factor A
MIPRRLERVESVLRKEIADLLLMKIKDPRIRDVHVVSVKVSPDLSTAKILYSTLRPTEEIETIQKGLDSAKNFVRSEIRKHVQLKKIPEVFFVYDPSIREGDRMLSLLKTLNPPPEDPSPDPTGNDPGSDPGDDPGDEDNDSSD